MALPNNDRIDQYTAVGSEAQFAYTFPVNAAADIVVKKNVAGVITTLTITTHYTVTSVGSASGGQIVLNTTAYPSGATAGHKFSIFGNQVVTRAGSSDFSVGGDFFAATINNQLDDLTQIAQDVRRDVNLSLKKDPAILETLDPLLPALTDRRTLVVNEVSTGNFNLVMSAKDPDTQEALAAAQVALATTQATNAATSASAASTSAAAAATSYDNFNDRYLGQKSSDPSVDNDGGSLLTGALYFNTSNNVMMVYTGSAWVRTTPTSSDQTAINGVNSNASNINTVAGISSNVTSVAGISSNVTTVAGIASDVTAVAGDATDIGAVAAKATEIGRLGTADAVADMAILGTADVVADLNTLGTADVVADLNTLGTADVVADMNTLGTADVVNDMNVLGTSSNVTNMNTLSGISGNITTVAGISANVTTVAGISANVTSVANNEANVNRYADEYTISSSAPGSPSEGDLWYDSTNNVLKVHNGSTFVAVTSATAGIASVADDSTPQLGGNLDLQSHTLSSAPLASGGVFSNPNTISGNTTITTASTTNQFLFGSISVTGTAVLTLAGNGALTII